MTKDSIGTAREKVPQGRVTRRPVLIKRSVQDQGNWCGLEHPKAVYLLEEEIGRRKAGEKHCQTVEAESRC